VAGPGAGLSLTGPDGLLKQLTESTGDVSIEVPGDQEGTFVPQIVRKRHRRLTGVDEIVLSLYAKVIFSSGVSRGCDLRRPVVNSVADGALAA
jgi:hypothetical protein